jgi:hypothetical protein
LPWVWALHAEALGYVGAPAGEPSIFIDFFDSQELAAFVVGIAVMVPLMGLAAAVPAVLLGSSWPAAFRRAVLAHGAVNASLMIIAFLAGGLYLTYLVAHTAVAAVASLLTAARSSRHQLIVPGVGVVLIALVVDLVGGDPFLSFYWLSPFLFSVLIWVVLTWQAGRVRDEVRWNREELKD